MSIVNLIYLWYNPFYDVYLGDGQLQWWIIIRLAAFVIQLPCRYCMYRMVSKATQTRDRHEVIESLLRICRTKVWKLSEKIGLFFYLWLFFGIYIMYSHWATLQSDILRLCIANMAVSINLTLISLVSLHSIMKHDGGVSIAMWDNGATPSVVEQFTRKMPFRKDEGDCKNMDECCVCFSAYSEGEIVRVLPCKHNYHAECIDAWLFNKRICPKCKCSIDHVKQD